MHYNLDCILAITSKTLQFGMASILIKEKISKPILFYSNMLILVMEGGKHEYLIW